MHWRERSMGRPAINEPAVILAMIDSLHGNPVRRGLVVRAEDWKWSSAGWHSCRMRGGQ